MSSSGLYECWCLKIGYKIEEEKMNIAKPNIINKIFFIIKLLVIIKLFNMVKVKNTIIPKNKWLSILIKENSIKYSFLISYRLAINVNSEVIIKLIP